MTNPTPDSQINTNGTSDSDVALSALAPDPNIGSVRPANIVDEMQTAYLDYAMSVIVSRALPDVRDGLKPVHRRILYAMAHDLYLTHDKPHRKSARIVGEVLGKYHPHGDVAVYDAMVRMAQDFSLRYPLIDGQGNFGSIDGDGAAAMRYTEARLAEISTLMLADLDKDTVDWHDNFDNSLQEPDILPAALPNLLINGASGIAVGMATNIPPHNLGEVVDALLYVIDNYVRLEEITVEDLMQFIKGPDFPTGGILYRYREDGKVEEAIDAIAQGYSVGRSRLILQAKAHFEEMSRGRMRIVVTELPYQTNKTALIERIASLTRDGKLEGLTDLRDESDRTGMRIVIELNRNTDPKATLKDLFKYTPLQQTFGLQMLALVDNQPRMLSLKRVLAAFIQHRQEIIRRRSEFDLQRARDRAHIVEGLLRALDILDEVIDTIRRSQNVETARNNLIKNFQFSQIQAQAILDMQLRRLAALERKKLKDEYDELLARIAYLEDLLAHPEKILAVIREDLLAQKEKYGDPRRTQIVDRAKGTLTTTDLLPQQDVWVTVSATGDLRRQDLSRLNEATLRKLGKAGQTAIVNANTRDWLYLFSRDGRCARVAIHEIPQDGTPKHVVDLTEFTRRDTITAAITLPRQEGNTAPGYLCFVTAQGMVKRVTMNDFLTPVGGEFVAMGVEEKDRLDWVFPTNGQQEIMLVTAAGQSIRFSEEDARSMGLAAGGVGGIKLQKKDLVVYAAAVESEGSLVTVTTQGFAKRTLLSDYSSQGRNGSGIVTHKPTSRTGDVATALMLPPLIKDEEILVAVTVKQAVKTLTLAAIPFMGRNVQGKAVLDDLGNDQVARLLRVQEELDPPSLENKASTPATPPAGNGSSGERVTSPASAPRVTATKGQLRPSTPAATQATATTPTPNHKVTAKTTTGRPVATNGEAAKPGQRLASAPVTMKTAATQSARLEKGAVATKATTPNNKVTANATAGRTIVATGVETKSVPPAPSTPAAAKIADAQPADKRAKTTAATTKPARQSREVAANAAPTPTAAQAQTNAVADATASAPAGMQVSRQPTAPRPQTMIKPKVADQTAGVKAVTAKGATKADVATAERQPTRAPQAQKAPAIKTPAATPTPPKATDKTVTTTPTAIPPKAASKVSNKATNKVPPIASPVADRTQTTPPATKTPAAKPATEKVTVRTRKQTYEATTAQSPLVMPEPVAKPQSAAARRANTVPPTAQERQQPAKSKVAAALAGQQPAATAQDSTLAANATPSPAQKATTKATIPTGRTARTLEQPRTLELFPLDGQDVATTNAHAVPPQQDPNVRATATNSSAVNDQTNKTAKPRKLQVAVSVSKPKRK